MKHLWNQTESYEDENGYIVDIVSTDFGTTYEAWLYHKNCGIKMHMYGMEGASITKSEFTDMALSQYIDYIDDYDENYNY